MIYAIVSILSSFIIAFGRQISVFGKIEAGLWFFSKYELKRIFFSLISIAFGLLSLVLSSISTMKIVLLVLSLLFLLFSYHFDMRYFFPEINCVIRKKVKDVDINENTQIIGLSINKTSVAYPLEDAVIPRHIIIDRIEGKQVLICYCALCQSALAFDTTLDDRELYFKVAGVWRRNMIIYDIETYSLWQQATGECIYGKYKGKKLLLLSGKNVTWQEWKKKHPDTEFAIACKEILKGYFTREQMNKLVNKTSYKITLPGYSNLIGLPRRETVFGINYNGISRAYPKSELGNCDSFEDQYLGKTLALEYNKEADYLYAREKKSGNEVIVEKHWWLGWKEFHPETKIWSNNTTHNRAEGFREE